MSTNQPPLQDNESFSNLFARTQLIIFRYIYGLHGGPIEDVEDLTCDTFLRAWQKWRNFSGDDHNALCWLFTIARHLVIDSKRRKTSHIEDKTIDLDDQVLDAIISSEQRTPEETLYQQEQFIHLWNLVQELPSEARELLVLRYILGWQVKQIAEYLNMEENTVSVYIHRNLERIRQNWSKP
jgi:RNA polymerase sigma-70 factor, ECF subfamily